MKYLYFLIFIAGISFSGHAQTGVGNPNGNPSAVLDLAAANKGVLIPRLALSSSTDATAITKGNVDGLLVFNTQTATDVVPGFYYWFNGKWNKIIVPEDIDGNMPAVTNELTLTGTQLTSTVNGVTSNIADLFGVSGWGLSGNEATTTSFLGTTNNQPLVFKTVNEDRMTIDANGRVGIGTDPSGYALAVKSPANDEYLARFVPHNFREGVAIGWTGVTKVGLDVHSDFKITPKGNGKINLDGPVVIKTLPAGAAGEEIVVADAENNLKKIAPALVGKTYTAGTGINVAGTVISAATTNTLELVGKNLISTVNGVSDTVDLTPVLATATTVSNTSAVNRIATTVNGITGTAVTIINSNALTLTDTGLTSTVNGVTSAVADLSGLAGWGLEGNEAAAASFLGTTNAESLKFKTANTDRIIIGANGKIGIGTEPSGFDLELVSTSNDDNLVSFVSQNKNQGVAFGYLGMKMVGAVTDADFRITPKGVGRVHLGGYTYIEYLPAGTAGEDVVVVDSDHNLKKMPSASVGKTYTAGTGIDVTDTVISAATSNTLTVTDGNLISTVNNVPTPAIAIVSGAENGLTSTNGTVILGGELTAPTTITATAVNTLNLTGLQETTKLNTDDVIVVNGAGRLKRTPATTFLNEGTTVSNTTAMNKLTTTVNGSEGAEIDIIKNVTMVGSNGNMTVLVNGVLTPGIRITNTAVNGITRTNGSVALGGALKEKTTIHARVNPLSIAGLQMTTTPATDAVVVAGDDGILKKASMTSYQTESVAPGGSGEITLELNSSYANFSISATNTCGRKAVAVFDSFGDLLVFAGGQAANIPYVASSTASYAGNSYALSSNGVGACADGGSSSQFDFAVEKTGNKVSITNNGNIAKRYTIQYSSM